MSTPALLAAALLLDAALGEPRALWARIPHPAVAMGRLVALLDTHLNHGRRRRLKGVAALGLLVAAAWLAGAVLAALPGGWLWQVLGAGVLLAQRSLADHVRAVADGLGYSLAAGRQAVARIVGRDTSGMDEPAIARAAIESAAENFADGVVAPAFWFLLGGLPAMAACKAVNTADSMIGYRNEKYAEFGWAAARLDDVLNYLPARLAALILLAAGPCRPDWAGLRADAARHRSPNAGWPEAAAARALEVSLAGPRSYFGQMRDYPLVNAGARPPGAADIDAAVALIWRGWAVLLGGCAVLVLIT